MDPVLADIFVKEMRGHLERDSPVPCARSSSARGCTRSKSRSIARATRCSAARAWRGSSRRCRLRRRSPSNCAVTSSQASVMTDAAVDALRGAAARDRNDGGRAGRGRSVELDPAVLQSLEPLAFREPPPAPPRPPDAVAAPAAQPQPVEHGTVAPASALRSRDRCDLRRGSRRDPRQLRGGLARGPAAAGSRVRRDAAALPAHAEGRRAHGRHHADGRFEPRARDVVVAYRGRPQSRNAGGARARAARARRAAAHARRDRSRAARSPPPSELIAQLESFEAPVAAVAAPARAAPPTAPRREPRCAPTADAARADVPAAARNRSATSNEFRPSISRRPT